MRSGSHLPCCPDDCALWLVQGIFSSPSPARTWSRSARRGTLASREGTQTTAATLGPRGRPQAPGRGPRTGRVAKALVVPFHQMEEVKCFLIVKLVSKYESTWKTSVPEPRGTAQRWGSQDPTPRSETPGQVPGARLTKRSLRPLEPARAPHPALPAELPKDYLRLAEARPTTGGKDLPTKGARPKGLVARDSAHTLRAGATPGRRPGAGAASGQERLKDISQEHLDLNQTGVPRTKAQGNQGGFLPTGGGVCLGGGMAGWGLGG